MGPETTTTQMSAHLSRLLRKQKGLVKEFGGIAIPFYTSPLALSEGQPVKHGTDAGTVVPLDDQEGALCIGLSLQNIVDDAALGQLVGTNMPNDTRGYLGQAVGILTGAGYAVTTFYEGTVTRGAQAYYNNTTKKLTADSSTAANALPIMFDAAATSVLFNPAQPPSVRIRFDFTMANGIGSTTIGTGDVTAAKIAANAVTTAKMLDANVTTAKLASGAVTPAKTSYAGLKFLTAAGLAAAGDITLTGAVATDRLVAVFGSPTAGGAMVAEIPGTDFEATIGVNDKIAQKAAAGDVHLNTYLFVLAPAAA